MKTTREAADILGMNKSKGDLENIKLIQIDVLNHCINIADSYVRAEDDQAEKVRDAIQSKMDDLKKQKFTRKKCKLAQILYP